MCYWSRNRRFFGFWNYSKCKVLVNVASPWLLSQKEAVELCLFDHLFLRKLRLLRWLCFTCLCIFGTEKPKNSCCCCSKLIVNEIMELGFDFANELGVKVTMETDIHPSSPTVAGVCFVLQRRSCCCSRIIKTISLYHATISDPLQLPNRTPDQLLGLQLLYRKQTDLYAWKKVPMPGAGF